MFSFFRRQGIINKGHKIQFLKAIQIGRRAFAVQAALFRNLWSCYIMTSERRENLFISRGITQFLKQHFRRFTKQAAVR